MFQAHATLSFIIARSGNLFEDFSTTVVKPALNLNKYLSEWTLSKQPMKLFTMKSYLV